MMRLVTLAGSLSSLTPSQPMDGQAMGRLVLQLVGLLVCAFLFHVALRDVTVTKIAMARFSGRSRRDDAVLTEPPDLSAFADSAPRSPRESVGLAGLS